MSDRVDNFISNPKKALFKISLPIIVGMLVQTLYNVVDTAFIGRLGSEAIAALTFAFPVFFILISVNAGLGIGMNSRIARYMGAKNKTAAENTAMHGLLVSLVLAVVIFVLGWFFLDDLFSLFGASEVVLDLAVSYMSIILIGMFFMFPTYVSNNIFSAQGDTKTPMKVQVSALVLNIILDPIFIYWLDLGVKGAAIATTIAFLLGLILSIYYIRKDSYLKLSFKTFNFSSYILKQISKVGLPATIMMLLVSVYVIFINKLMSGFGVDYVAAFGLVYKLESVATMPIVALSLGLLPLVGMFYGAKRYDLIKKLFWYSMKLGMVFVFIIGLFFFFIPSIFFRIFTSDANLLLLSVKYMRIQVFGFFFIVVSMMVARVMQGLGLGIPGLIIMLIRLILVTVPIAYLLVNLGYGFISPAFASLLGGLVASMIGLSWVVWKLNKLDTTGH